MRACVRVRVHVCVCVHAYGSEAWTTKREEMKKLESLHNRCLRGILSITRVPQWGGWITSSQVRERLGMVEIVEEMVMLQRMRWLGHMARMADTRLPKQALFGRLQKARPFHGTKLRWRDRVMKDMALLGVERQAV